MSRYRNLSAAAAMVSVSVLAFSSAAAAHPGHDFDNVWIGTPSDDSYEAQPGDRDLLIGRAGNDKIAAGDKRDVVRAGPGDDSYTADDIDRVADNCENDITPAPTPAP
jgi:hypothetical protein